MGYLVTPGAAGTHALAAVACLALKNGDASFNPHNRNPSALPHDARVAYVYSNAFDTVLSFWRRGFMFKPDHAKHLGLDEFVGCTEDMKLATWLHNVKFDPFKLKSHMAAWAERPGTMMVKYECLKDPGVVANLGDWIGADLSGFKFRRRSSCWFVEPHSVIGRLCRLYSHLFSIQYELPDWFVTE